MSGDTMQDAIAEHLRTAKQKYNNQLIVGAGVAHNSSFANPKSQAASTKLPMHLWPESATAMGCLALHDGALKYGRNNFRATPVQASDYVSAARRHLAAWFEGENTDPDSGLHHLGHALASIAIIIEAEIAGTLTDDRNLPTGWRDVVNETTPHVARLRELHANKTPKHYTIEDRQQ